MSLEDRNLITAKEFGPEFAGQRVGWSAITGYGMRQDKVIGVHLATTTIGEEGAKLEYELRENDGETQKLYWSDAEEGFIAMAGISVIIDTDKGPDEQRRVGPYFSFENYSTWHSSDPSRILRLAGDGHSEEDELDEKKIWAESSEEVIAHTKESMAEMGLADYYPLVYYTANVLIAHDRFRMDSALRKVPTETTLFPDASMHAATTEEIATASEIVENLSSEDEQDEAMIRNLSVFGNIPAELIPTAFKNSRGKVADAEQRAIAAEKKLRTQDGVFLPIGFHGGRSWPYMDASLPPTDERAFGMELDSLSKGKPKMAEVELERERGELETRIKFATQGMTALKLLSQAEVSIS